jgi:hypothetical protein
MHRSGTSALTRVLSIAGAKLPATLLGGSKGNEAGHWESAAIAAYNDQLLSQLGTRWWDWRPVDVGQLPISRRQEIKAEIADLVSSEYGDAPLFVVKDPRICRFAPLFLDVLDDMGVEARIVHIVRNPLEVADSLERRDALPRMEGVLQWLRHVLDGEASTRTRMRVFVSYSALLKDGCATLKKITDDLRIPWPYSIEDVGDQVAQFLDHGQRHHARTVEDVLLDPAVRDWAGEAYSALLVLEQNLVAKAAMTALDTIRQEFNHAVPILHAMVADTRSALERQHAVALAEREQEVGRLRAELGKVQTDAAQLAQALEGQQAEEARLKSALDESALRAVQLAGTIEEHERQEAHLRAELGKVQTDAAQLTQALEGQQAEEARLKSVLDDSALRAVQLAGTIEEHERQEALLKEMLDEAEAKMARLTGAWTQSGRQAFRLDAALVEMSAEIERFSAALAGREEERARFKGALAEAQRDAADLRSLAEIRASQVRRLEAEKAALLQQTNLSRQELIEHFRSSTSWKLTRPLRSLKLFVPQLAPLPRMPNLFVRARQSRSDAAVAIAESGLFNELYYGSLIRDEGVTDLVEHYLQLGHKKGIDPNPLFDSDYYTTRYAAHIDESINPFIHFIQHGSRLGFDPCRLFQTAFYCDSNPEVRDSGISPLLHYVRFGRVEGRIPIDRSREELDPLALQLHQLNLADASSDQFNAQLYAALYPEIAAHTGGDERALLNDYSGSGRIGSLGGFLRAMKMPPEAVPIDFKASEYYELNADLGTALPNTFFHAIAHYLEAGIRERRRYAYSQCYIDGPGRHLSEPRQAARAEEAGAVTASGEERDGHKIACLVNMHQSESWPNALYYLRSLDSAARDLVVGIDDEAWSEELHAQIKRDAPDASIVVTEAGKGSILGCIELLDGIGTSEYSAIVLVHAGELRGIGESDRLAQMLGSSEAAHQTFNLLTSDPEIGIIAAGSVEPHDASPASENDDLYNGSMGPLLIVRPRLARRVYEELRGTKPGERAPASRPADAAGRFLADVGRSLGYRIHVQGRS